MRCTRCDRPAVPQAVGFLPEGPVVFGWCVRCLEETGCRRVEVARSPRRSSTRLVLRRRSPRLSDWSPRRAALPPPPDDRHQVVVAVASLLALWGLALCAVGLSLAWRRPSPDPSPLGNGTPALLIGGGGSTAIVGLSLWAMISGRAFLRSGAVLKAVQVLAFVVALAVLATGIVFHAPRRDPLIVAVSSLALGVSVAAHWLNRRRLSPLTPGS